MEVLGRSPKTLDANEASRMIAVPSTAIATKKRRVRNRPGEIDVRDRPIVPPVDRLIECHRHINRRVAERQSYGARRLKPLWYIILVH